MTRKPLLFFALLIAVLLAAQGLVGLATPDVFLNAVRFMQMPPMIYGAAVLRAA